MSNPDYQNYSLQELYEALEYIDEAEFPDNVENIRIQIDKRKKEIEMARFNQPQLKSGLNNAFNFKRFLFYFEKGSFFLKILSFLIGLVLILFLFEINISNEFGYELDIDFPGISYIDDIFTLRIFFAVLISLFFIIGSIGSIFNDNFIGVLALAWGIMSIGFHIWFIKWWPQFNFDYSFYFGLTILIPIYFKINFTTSFFFLWSIVIVPKLRKEFFKTTF